jgi:hypothetical protein
MAELVQTYAEVVRDPQGVEFAAFAFGEEREDGTWVGWLEFWPVDIGPRRRTDRETTQPNLDAIRYWASGLEPVYLDGAFARAS